MEYAITNPNKIIELKNKAQDYFKQGQTFNQVYIQGYADAYNESMQKKDIDVSEAELIVAKMYIADEIAKYPDCMELETISKILNSFEKKCPKGNDTHWTCYEVCEYRENGICTFNN